MLPPDAAVLLAEAAQSMDVPLSERQVGQLLDYVALLQKWNRVFNLTGVRNPAHAVTLHVLDCLSIVAPLRRRAPTTLADVGSGAGLPGVIVAIAAPEIRVTCIDAVAKKAAFVAQAAAELDMANVGSRHARVESFEGRYDVVTSRAFSTLVEFAMRTRHLLGERASWVAMKGRYPVDEITGLPAEIEVFHVEQPKVPGLSAERCLVWMRPVPAPS